MVLGLFRPADQQSPVAVQPGVTALDHPAAGLEVGIALLGVDLLAAGSQVQGQVALGGDLTGPGVVVALVETEPLRFLGGRFRSFDRDRVQ